MITLAEQMIDKIPKSTGNLLVDVTVVNEMVQASKMAVYKASGEGNVILYGFKDGSVLVLHLLARDVDGDTVVSLMHEAYDSPPTLVKMHA